MVVAVYMIFAMSDVATAVSILFLLHDIDLELDFEVR
jgi:NTP pyrophosphatase (non-canonical NTP hydrolase)